MSHCPEYLDDTSPESPVRGFMHRPVSSGNDGLVLSHGAGSNCNAPLLVALADAFCDAGWTVLRCDLPFRQLRATGPPPRGSAERDQQGLSAALASLQQHVTGRAFLGGHSYGGRQASMLAAQQPGLVDRLLLLSYPLHPPRRPDDLRTTHWAQLRTPALFVHGTRDPFATLDELTAALPLIDAPTELLPVPGAGHELAGTRNRDEVSQKIAESFKRFVSAG